MHGMLLASLFSQLVGMRIPGTSAFYLGQDLAFRWPVLVGEFVRSSAKVTAKNEATMPLVLATELRNAAGSFLGRITTLDDIANTVVFLLGSPLF